jgi:hypothetical protein
MRVYHGSTIEIQKPDLSFAKRNLDFGPGFYVTTIQDQAENWARRKALRRVSNAIIGIYDLKEISSNYRKIVFDGNDKDWVEFVCACRRGDDLYNQFDIISGGVANDKVYRAVDMYYRGIWDIDRTLSELKFYEQNDQICLLNQQLLDDYLAFFESYEVKSK